MKKDENGASEICARANRARLAREGPGAGKGGWVTERNAHPELRPRVRVEGRVRGGSVAARGRAGGRERMMYAPRACEARGDANSVRLR